MDQAKQVVEQIPIVRIALDLQKALTDPLGMMWTPFFKLRGDVTSMNIDNQPGVSNFLDEAPETPQTELFPEAE